MAVTYSYSFVQPMWLAALVLLVPVVYLAMRSLDSISPLRRWMAMLSRCVLVTILVLLLARLTRVKQNDELTVVSVVDRSQSIPTELLEDRLNYLAESFKYRPEKGCVAMVDVAEMATISHLPSRNSDIQKRNTSLRGVQSKLADGVQMALAIAPPDTATRILLLSDGNQTEGDLKEAAEIAVMNNIPIDVLPVRYRYANEVIFKTLNAPARANSNQTISLRFVLKSTSGSSGKIHLNLNGAPVDLVPESPDVAADVRLVPGTNVHSIALPVGTRGVHEFTAVYIPNDVSADQVEANNCASAITYVSGPGRVLVVDGDGSSAASLLDLLSDCKMNVEVMPPSEFPDNITQLIDTDAVVLVNTGCSEFSWNQQELLVQYVANLGGGLVMTGGPDSFGAGGWIGSPIQEILPVDLDPPQKKQMPKGALVLVIDYSGSMTGEKVEMCKVAAKAAVRLLSKLDLVGVVVFDDQSSWLVPLRPAEDKQAIVERINSIGAGGGTVMGPAMEKAFKALEEVESPLRHVILLTDGITTDREFCAELGAKMGASEITVSTVGVGPEADGQLLFGIAQATKGRFYRVINPTEIPKIFVKEAQVVRRALIVEKAFVPQITFSIDEVLKGISSPLPTLDGFVLTGIKGGLSRLIVADDGGDPIVASCQAGLGRCAVFTSTLDSRWGAQWLAWGNCKRFAEQLVRWAAKPSQSSDCEILVDVQGRNVSVHIEAIDEAGEYIRLSNMAAQVMLPDITTMELPLTQVGPGQYKGQFEAKTSGSHLLNLKYTKVGGEQSACLMQTPFTVPFAPEFSDLTDNMALLQQVCDISGGRMIETEPAKADLFNITGVKFPQTQILLTKPLMLLWLAVFLFDVAVRRLAIDFKAIAKKAVSLVSRRGKLTASQKTLVQLKKSRKKLAKDLYRADAEAVRTKRYVADGAVRRDIPVSMVAEKETVSAAAAQDKAAQEKKVSAGQQLPAEGHIQQLLKAKKKALHKDDEHKN